jgi:hypothetical protein
MHPVQVVKMIIGMFLDFFKKKLGGPGSIRTAHLPIYEEF